MTASNDLTWDQAVPRRPGIDDLGGGQKENARGRHANPRTTPVAEEFNQTAKQIAALSKMVPGLTMSVRFSAGAPVIDSFASPTAIAIGDFPALVDNGAGDTTIRWVKGRIPLPDWKPKASVNAAAADYRIAIERYSDATYDGVRVRTKDAGGAADVAFTFDT